MLALHQQTTERGAPLAWNKPPLSKGDRDNRLSIGVMYNPAKGYIATAPENTEPGRCRATIWMRTEAAI